jgi:outer membrane lipoprotein-sorting protein
MKKNMLFIFVFSLILCNISWTLPQNSALTTTSPEANGFLEHGVLVPSGGRANEQYMSQHREYDRDKISIAQLDTRIIRIRDLNDHLLNYIDRTREQTAAIEADLAREEGESQRLWNISNTLENMRYSLINIGKLGMDLVEFVKSEPMVEIEDGNFTVTPPKRPASAPLM